MVLLLWNLRALIYHPKHMQLLQHAPQMWSKAKVSEDVKVQTPQLKGMIKIVSDIS
jgi:hypothetical protein